MIGWTLWAPSRSRTSSSLPTPTLTTPPSAGSWGRRPEAGRPWPAADGPASRELLYWTILEHKAMFTGFARHCHQLSVLCCTCPRLPGAPPLPCSYSPPPLTPSTLGSLAFPPPLLASPSFTDSICLSLSHSSEAHSSRLWAQTSFPAPDWSLCFGEVAASVWALGSSSLEWKEHTHSSKTQSFAQAPGWAARGTR